MKKLISLALAIVMVMCLSTTAFATTAEAPGDYTAEVTGSYVPGNEGSGIVYCVDIAWGDLNFTYHAEKGAVWHTDSLTYSKGEDAYWVGESTITVTNRSNTKISVEPKYAPATGYEGAGMTFGTNKLKVASAELGTAQTGTITVKPNGYLPAMDASATIGTITLTIAQEIDVTVEEAWALIDTVEALEEEWLTITEDGGTDADYKAMSEYCTATVNLLHELEETEGALDEYDQKSLNGCYKDLLELYNVLKAKMAALS